jgi:hypothetical protein
MSPFSVVQAAGTHTTLFGLAVPNWILFGVYVLFLTRLLLLGAASSLSPFNSWETKNLRVTAVVACGVFGFLLGYMFLSVVGPTAPYAGGAATGPNTDLIAANIFALVPMVLLIPLPFIACSGTDAEKKFMPNGTFSFKEAIRGTPAGALPFLLMSIAAVAFGVFGAYVLAVHKVPGGIFVSSVVWALGFWVFCWSFGRWASATSFELKSARTLHLASLIVLLGLPLPFLAIVDSEQQTPLWSFYPLYPLWMQGDDPSMSRFAMGTALLVVGLLIAFFSNRKLQARLAASPVMG